MKKSRWIIAISILFVGFFGGCEDAFEFSPYAANVKDSYKDIGVENRNELVELNKSAKEEYKFAVFCDPHYSYHELDEAVVNVNRRDDIDFVVVNGDIADHGYLVEYELFHARMKNLRVPYLTTIGNHDYRSNGEKIYKEMYGNPNYTLDYSNDLFIMWDDVFWESNKSPDWEWLENELEKNDHQAHVFVICHIPPFGSQYDEEDEQRYSELMSKYQIDLSIHGHIHSNSYSEYYNDGVNYLAVESIIDKEYAIITVTNEEVLVEVIKY